MPSLISDFGWTATEIIRQAAIAYVAITNTQAAIKIAEKQRVIAQQSLDLANELRSIWKDVYLENERKFTFELFNTATLVAEYTLWAGRAAPVVAGQFAEARRRLNAFSPKFCCGDTSQRMIELEIAEATARGNAIMYGMRFADAKKLALEDRDYSRKHAAISLGRGLGSQAQTYASAAAGLYGQLGQQAAAGASGAFGALGYFSTRNQVGAQSQPQIQSGGAKVGGGYNNGEGTGSFEADFMGTDALSNRGLDTGIGGFDSRQLENGIGSFDNLSNGSFTNPALPASTGITGLPQETPPDLADIGLSIFG